MSQALTNYSVSDMERMALAFAASKLFGISTPDQALALCLVAQAEGRHPASAAQDYHIIQGKPSKKADAMLRDFLANSGKVQWHELTDEVVSATFSHPAGGSVKIDWDMARATKAGISTPMWKKYPRQMLRARVVSEGVRTVFPLATSGMYVPEEVVEFDAPKGSKESVNQAFEGTTIEAETLPPPDAEPERNKLVKTSREAEKQMRQEVDACGTVADLQKLWNSPTFQTEFEKLHQTYRDGMIELFNDRINFLRANPAPAQPDGFVPPDFTQLEQESAVAQ